MTGRLMPGENLDYLAGKLRGGACLIGQVLIRGNFSLCHVEDAAARQAATFADPHDAIEIARFDDAGLYRPLKTAPNLRHGWRLTLQRLPDVLLALDFLYPAAIGTALAWERGRLPSVSLRDTLERQTGMYAVVKRITERQAADLASGFCRTGCLRKILWPLSPREPAPPATSHSSAASHRSEIPLLCPEACNLFVAAGRKAVKEPAG